MNATRRHPKALPYLFLTEMWERLGFYIVQGMLVLYMTKAYGFSDDQSYTIAGVFTSLAYIAPMLGGVIADRILGFKLSIVFGGIFLSAGYAILATPFPTLFYVGLATVIVGNGLFKPNISSLLGLLYPVGNTARDTGFTIFYIGINIGALLSGVSGTIQQYFGWHMVFLIASMGLLIGLCVFAAGMKWGDMQFTVEGRHALLKHPLLSSTLIFFYCLLLIAALSFLLHSSILGKWLLPMVGILLLIFMFVLAFRQDPLQRNRLITLNVLIISSVVFWALFWQIFFSVNLFIDRIINKQVFGIEISTTWFYTLESVFIVILGPFFAWSWQTLNRNEKNPTPFAKFILAIFSMGFAFLILMLSTFFPEKNHLVNPLWVVFSYLFITMGDLLLSPIGLAAVVMLSPARLTGMMMGIWFSALGFGGQFGGLLAKMSSIPENAKDVTNQLPIYREAFLNYASIALGVAFFLFILQFFLRKLNERAGVIHNS